MLIKNTIKQLFRTPLKTILFILLISVAVTFLLIGLILWQGSSKSIEEVKNSFQTIGTIQQKHDSMKVYTIWNGESYFTFDFPYYQSNVLLSQLEGLPYAESPEKREFYYAHVPKLQKALSPLGKGNHIKEVIFEFEPLDDFNAKVLGRIKITRWIYNYYDEKDRAKTVYFKDGREDVATGKKEIILKKGKKYVAKAYDTLVKETDGKEIFGYVTSFDIPSQKNKLDPTSDEVVAPAIVEVKNGFYDTETAQIYFEQAKLCEMLENTLPVLPTKNKNLMMPFFQNEATITSGRDITKDEYNNGERVCLIPQYMAERGDLAIGDKIQLNMFQANCFSPASRIYMPSGHCEVFSRLYNKKCPEYFDSSSYTIVGTYTYNNSTGNPLEYELAFNGVIVPSSSIKNMNNANVIEVGPMQAYNTSFRIENSTADEFMKEFAKLNLTNIDIQFYDKGYTKIIGGLNSMKTTAIVLFIISTVCIIGILILFVYLQIGRHKREAAIQLSLGAGRKKCAIQLMMSVNLIVLIGCIVGSILGQMLSKNVFEKTLNLSKETAIETIYSDSVNSADQEAKLNSAESTDIKATFYVVLITICITLFLSALSTYLSLKQEPMKLLSQKRE